MAAIKQWYYKNPVRLNLILLSLLVFLGTTIPSILIINYYNTKATREEIMKSAEASSRQAGMNLTDTLKGVSKISTAILSNPSLHQLLSKDITGREASETVNLENTLYTICSTSTNKLSAYVYDLNGVCYYTDSYRTKILTVPLPEDPPVMAQITKRQGAPVILFTEELYAGAAGQGGLSLVRLINHPETLATIGTLVINITAQDAAGCFDSYMDDDEGIYLIADRQGRTLLSVNEKEGFDPEWIRQTAGTDTGITLAGAPGASCLITANYLEDYNLVLYGCIPLGTRAVPLQAQLRYILPVILLNMTIMIAGLIIVARSFTGPLLQLSAHMGEVVLKDFTPFTTAYKEPNELGILADGFNRMTFEIERLIKKEIDIQKHKRHLELNLLQAQFKPHFLYNTIDMARSLCLQGKADTAGQILKAMGNYYKNILSKGKTIIALADELETIRQYEFIRQYKEDSEIVMAYEVSPDTLRLPVLKFVLQPLVENALKHGLRRCEEGLITVSAVYQDNRLTLAVADNGVGMEEALAKGIRSGQAGHPDTGFGLRATIERMKLYYGEDCRMTVDSRPDEGTRIIFEIHNFSDYIPEGWE